MYRVTTDPNDPNGYHRYFWQQTGDKTATITLLMPQIGTDEEKQLLRQLGLDPDDLTFPAQLQGDTWVVNDAKYHRFAGVLAAVVAAAVGGDLTQAGQIAPVDVDMHIKFVDRSLLIEFVKGGETISSEKKQRLNDALREVNMRTAYRCVALVAVTTAVLWVAATRAGEIAGKVETVNGKTLTIVSTSNVPPRPGDPLVVYFQFPDEGQVLVARGVVDKIAGRRITARVTNLMGTLAKGELVRITSRGGGEMIARPRGGGSQIRTMTTMMTTIRMTREETTAGYPCAATAGSQVATTRRNRRDSAAGRRSAAMAGSFVAANRMPPRDSASRCPARRWPDLWWQRIGWLAEIRHGVAPERRWPDLEWRQSG